MSSFDHLGCKTPIADLDALAEYVQAIGPVLYGPDAQLSLGSDGDTVHLVVGHQSRQAVVEYHGALAWAIDPAGQLEPFAQPGLGARYFNLRVGNRTWSGNQKPYFGERFADFPAFPIRYWLGERPLPNAAFGHGVREVAYRQVPERDLYEVMMLTRFKAYQERVGLPFLKALRGGDESAWMGYFDGAVVADEQSEFPNVTRFRFPTRMKRAGGLHNSRRAGAFA